MNDNPAIVVVGSYAVGMTMRVERAPEPGETVEGYDYQRMHGGKGSNQAVACARLGETVSLIAAIGDDVDGAAAKALYGTEGVRCDGLRIDPSLPTGVGFIIVDPKGENQIVVDFGANRALTPEYVRSASSGLSSSRVWLTQLEIAPDTAMEAMRMGKSHGARTILNPAPYRPLPESIWKFVDIVTPNESEAARLLCLEENHSCDLPLLAGRLREKGPSAVIVTLGKRGVYLDCDEYCGELEPIIPDDPVVDTTGAGDTFAAALAVSLSRGSGMLAAVRYAMAAAAICVTRYGVIPALPYKEEVDSLIARRT